MDPMVKNQERMNQYPPKENELLSSWEMAE
jgi:hypothetical protein